MNRLLILLIALFHVASIANGQWTQQTSPTSALLIGVGFASPSNGWIVGQNGTLLHTTNHGVVWSDYGLLTSSNLNKIAFIDSLHGYIVGDQNTILATADGGSSWRYVNDGNPSLSHYYGLKISKSATKAWVAGGRDFTGLSSVLGMQLGYTAPQYQDATGRCVGIDFLDDQVGWVAGMNRLIIKTTNGGASWTQLAGDPDGGYTGLNGIRFLDAGTGLAVGDSGAIIKTVDGGSTWHHVRKKDEILFYVDLQTDSVAWVVGSQSAVLRSTDRGENWQEQATPVPAGTTFQQVFFLDANEGWIVGSNGTILHTTNGGLTAVGEASAGLPAGFALKANYPNPFNPSTTFEYEIGKTSAVDLKIYDIIGREVEVLSEGVREPGRYTRTWNAGRFASGVYYCRLTAMSAGGTHISEQKIVLTK